MTRVGPELVGTCLVVGTGLIGTSVALALRRHGVQVHLTDRDPAAVRRAADLGAGEVAPPDHQVDVAVVAVPPSATAPAVTALLTGGAAATVVDTAGVKAGIAAEISASFGTAPHFVGSHPMAGRERSGPTAARADLFEGRPWVLVPGAEERSMRRAYQLVELCGGLPVEMDAVSHDTAVASVSHLPQVAASAVAAQLAIARPDAVALTGQGLRDLTRIAASDAGLWLDVLTANARPVAAALARLRDDLDEVIEALGRGAGDPVARAVILDLLVRGNAGRARLPGKHGGTSRTYAVVPVVLADRPGELARLFADVGAVEVNVEDVRIEHVPGQPTGVVELAVAPEAAARLTAALSDRGWVVHGGAG